MKEHNWILVIFMLFLAVILSFLLNRKGLEFGNPNTTDISTFLTGKSYKVNYIRVLSGSEFDLRLDNGKRIHARLAVNTSPDAKTKVITYLNYNGNQPRVVILGKQDDAWIVDLYVRKESQPFEEVSLTKWLQESGLVWESL